MLTLKVIILCESPTGPCLNPPIKKQEENKNEIRGKQDETKLYELEENIRMEVRKM